MKAMFLVVATFVLLVFSIFASAHEVRPAYLEVREVTSKSYDFMWKTPAQGDMRLNLNVTLPQRCITQGLVRTTKVNGAVVQSWHSQCENGLLDKTIHFENLKASLTDVILQYQPLSGNGLTLRILGSEPQVKIPLRQHGWMAAETYFRYGVTHILAGIDHLLFVFCLLLLIKSRKQLLVAITAFTLAHSITLMSTTLGWLHLPVAPVEATIALSIAFLAAEIIQVQKGKKSNIHRWPWLASFGFGLLHGFGFATALGEIGISADSIAISLLFFNLGIEAGQLMFVATVLSLWLLWRKFLTNLPPLALKYTSYGIGILAGYWFIDRAAGIF